MTRDNLENGKKGLERSARVKLSSLGAGAEVKVAAVSGSGPISLRLQEMGIVPGISLRVVKTAPFGDPFEIRLLGYSLAMRRNEADLVEVFA